MNIPAVNVDFLEAEILNIFISYPADLPSKGDVTEHPRSISDIKPQTWNHSPLTVVIKIHEIFSY